MNLFRWLFDTTPFTPRFACSGLSPALGAGYVVTESSIALVYLLLSLALLGAFRRWRLTPPLAGFPGGLLAWFAAFILCCGATHVLKALAFWWPVYHLGLVVNGGTALVSVGALLSFFRALPDLRSLRTDTRFVEEMQRRERAEYRLAAYEDAMQAQTALRAANNRLGKALERMRGSGDGAD